MNFFLSATDTNAGKTFACALLLRAAQSMFPIERQSAVLARKPLCCGGEEDLTALCEAHPGNISPHQLCYLSLKMAATPSVAAEAEGFKIEPAKLVAWSRKEFRSAEFGILEGVGGWRVPISGRWTVADWAEELGWPVILVVPNRLGCLNHALLTVRDLAHQQVPLAGLVLNRMDKNVPAALAASNRKVLEEEFALPVLGEIPFGATVLPEGILEQLLKIANA